MVAVKERHVEEELKSCALPVPQECVARSVPEVLPSLDQKELIWIAWLVGDRFLCLQLQYTCSSHKLLQTTSGLVDMRGSKGIGESGGAVVLTEEAILKINSVRDLMAAMQAVACSSDMGLAFEQKPT